MKIQNSFYMAAYLQFTEMAAERVGWRKKKEFKQTI